MDTELRQEFDEIWVRLEKLGQGKVLPVGPPIVPPGPNDSVKITGTADIIDLFRLGYSRYGFWTAINESAKESGHRWELVDGCVAPSQPDPPTHPGGSHGGWGGAADFNYPTVNLGFDHTEVRHKSHAPIGTIIPIWAYETLNSNFNTPIMLAFILAMVKRVPTVWFRVDERIKSVLLTECGWDNAKADIVNKAIQGDPPKAYDHHTHFHMQMNKEKM